MYKLRKVNTNLSDKYSKCYIIKLIYSYSAICVFSLEEICGWWDIKLQRPSSLLPLRLISDFRTCKALHRLSSYQYVQSLYGLYGNGGIELFIQTPKEQKNQKQRILFKGYRDLKLCGYKIVSQRCD